MLEYLLFHIFYLSLSFKLPSEPSSGAAWMETDRKRIYTPRSSTWVQHCILWKAATISVSTWVSYFHHSWSELGLTNTCDYCRVIWPGNECRSLPFPVEDKSQTLIGVFCPMWKGYDLIFAQTQWKSLSILFPLISPPNIKLCEVYQRKNWHFKRKLEKTDNHNCNWHGQLFPEGQHKMKLSWEPVNIFDHFN